MFCERNVSCNIAKYIDKYPIAKLIKIENILQ